MLTCLWVCMRGDKPSMHRAQFSVGSGIMWGPWKKSNKQEGTFAFAHEGKPLSHPKGAHSATALRRCICPRQAALGTSHRGGWVDGEERSAGCQALPVDSRETVHTALLTLGPQMRPSEIKGHWVASARGSHARSRTDNNG